MVDKSNSFVLFQCFIYEHSLLQWRVSVSVDVRAVAGLSLM